MTRRPSESAQGDLLDQDDPKPNSPDDLGFGRPSRPPDVDRRPSSSRSYGSQTPGPDPVPQNVATGTIQYQDAKKFVDWLHDQDLPTHADVTIGHVLVALSGLTRDHLGWLCRGVRQAERIPAPWIMKLAAMKNDVGLLRPENEPEPPGGRRSRQKD